MYHPVHCTVKLTFWGFLLTVHIHSQTDNCLKLLYTKECVRRYFCLFAIVCYLWVRRIILATSWRCSEPFSWPSSPLLERSFFFGVKKIFFSRNRNVVISNDLPIKNEIFRSYKLTRPDLWEKIFIQSVPSSPPTNVTFPNHSGWVGNQFPRVTNRASYWDTRFFMWTNHNPKRIQAYLFVLQFYQWISLAFRFTLITVCKY